MENIFKILLKEFKSPLFYGVGSLILTLFLVIIYFFHINMLGIWKFIIFLIGTLFATVAISTLISLKHKQNKIEKYLKYNDKYLSRAEINILKSNLEKTSQHFSVPREDAQARLVSANSLVQKV